MNPAHRMNEFAHPKQIGGTSYHIGDCHVWAEIHYLDSPTDYREYLSAKNLGSPHELVMLDDTVLRATHSGLLVAALPCCMLLVVAVLAVTYWA
jgi:hypothetical protein